MKCPLVAICFAITKTSPREYAGDCLEKECAWWVSSSGMCSIRYQAIKSSLIENTLSDIAKELTLVRPK